MDQNNVSSFEESVSAFSHQDVKGNADDDKRAMLPSLIVRCIMIALCIGIFGYAVFMIASSAVETDEANDYYGSLRGDGLSSAVKPSTHLYEPSAMLNLKDSLDTDGTPSIYKDIDSGSVQDPQRRSSIYRNYMSLTSKYPDMYAWIYVNFTDIHYPVMKGPYTNYYLNHTIDGAESSYGSITADSNLADTYTANMNNVIYGHCMKNGTMFRSLKTFMESANRNTKAKSMSIEIYTEEGLYIYKVLSGYRNDDNHYAQTVFTSTEEYAAFLQKIVSRNELSVSNSYDTSSRIVTLITCANVTSNDDERYILHGVLTSFIPKDQL